LDNLAFRLTPEDLLRLTPDSVNGVAVSKDGVRFADVAADIRAAYQVLWPYVQKGEIAAARKLPAHDDFRTKVGWLYEALAATPGIGERYAYEWITFWLAGMTPSQVEKTARAAFAEATAGPIERRVWPSQTAGRAGKLEYRFVHGLRAQPEMQALMGAIGQVGPHVYVVSASAEPIVEVAASALSYPVAPASVYGARLKMKDGKYLPELVDPGEYPFTYREGKVEAIRRMIKTTPVFVAGDSDGDYAMLTAFESLQMRLIINRNKKGDIHTLYEEAIKTASDSGTPRTLLQGRNENEGAFRPGGETVPPGKSEPAPLR
jgi:phosphoserine phosphatase